MKGRMMIDQLRINSSSCLSRLRESIVRIISYLRRRKCIHVKLQSSTNQKVLFEKRNDGSLNEGSVK